MDGLDRRSLSIFFKFFTRELQKKGKGKRETTFTQTSCEAVRRSRPTPRHHVTGPGLNKTSSLFKPNLSHATCFSPLATTKIK